MRHPKNVPDWGFSGDARAWRRLKRKEWRAVIEAIGVFRIGCAYTPISGNDIDAVEKLGERLSPAKWGR